MATPYIAKPSRTRFFKPPTLQADFDRFLDGDLPNQVMDFELIPDWYARSEPDYEPKIIRGEFYPDSTKSRYENTDSAMNIRCSVTSGIKKGDMVIPSNTGIPYILDWEIHLESNNAPSRALRCNFYLTIKRYSKGKTDSRGIRTTAPGFETVVDALPVNGYRYDGRRQYSAASGTPGVTPNASTLVTVQYNDQTKNIHVNDEFQWGDETYQIVDVNRSGLNLEQTSGTLVLWCNEKAGGLDYAT